MNTFVPILFFYFIFLDNLVKGASGQAIQNMNLMLGFPETTSLMQAPMFP